MTNSTTYDLEVVSGCCLLRCASPFRIECECHIAAGKTMPARGGSSDDEDMEEDMESMSPVTELEPEEEDVMSDVPSSVTSGSMPIPNHLLHPVATFSCEYPGCNAVSTMLPLIYWNWCCGSSCTDKVLHSFTRCSTRSRLSTVTRRSTSCLGPLFQPIIFQYIYQAV